MIQEPVIMAEMAIFTKLLPTHIAVMNLSIFEIKRCIVWARLMPRETIWRRRILLKAITEVSDAEKIKETMVRTNNRIIVIGQENTGCILVNSLSKVYTSVLLYLLTD